MPKTIVISAIALRSGGTLSILQDCIRELRSAAYSQHRIVAIVKDKALIDSSENIEVIELDGSKSYFARLYYEYFYFRKLSAHLKADVWISLHDITPNVNAAVRAVYCHNPSAFYNVSIRELLLDPKFGFFTTVYWMLYRINVRKNRYVVVQQQWVRNEFSKMSGMSKDLIIVSHPNIAYPSLQADLPASHEFTFFYPTFPRVFKNIELIGAAIGLLKEKGISGFKVIITIDGSENGYTLWLRRKFGHLKELSLIGRQSRQDVFDIYTKSDVLIFPSKLETWGLPISEFKQTGKPLLLADLPYAHETAGDYKKTVYFNPESAPDLAKNMEMMISGKISYEDPKSFQIAPPFAPTWSALFAIVIPS